MLSAKSKEAVQRVFKFWEYARISDVVTHKRRIQGFKPLIATHQNTTLAEVLEALHTHDLLAMPVYSTPDDPKLRKYLGFVSLYDICSWSIFKDVFEQGKDVEPVHDWLLGLTNPFKYGEEAYFMSTKIKDVMGRTDESMCNEAVHSRESLSGLLKRSTELIPLHRFLVLDDASEKPVFPSNVERYDVLDDSSVVLTQTDILFYIHFESSKHRAKDLQSLLAVPLETISGLQESQSHEKFDVVTPESGPQRPHVLKCSLQTPTVAAFRRMYLNRVQAVAIVDTEGKFVSTVSASDLRGITPYNISMLKGPLIQFLEHVKLHSKSRLQAGMMRPDQNVGEALKSMIKHHLHRVWLVDEDDKPVGVVSMTDILSLFVPKK